MFELFIDGQHGSDISWTMQGSSGLFNGYRALTTIGIRHGIAMDLQRHLQRLIAHAEIMKFENIPKIDLLMFECSSIAAKFRGESSARLRVILFLDAANLLRRLVVGESVNMEEHTKQLQKGLQLRCVIDKSWERGGRVKTGIIDARGSLITLAKEAGFDDVLWCNGDGEIAETTSANIFLIGRTGDLVEIATPPISSGILEGVTRRRMMDLLTHAKIPVTERVITVDEIPGFDECFVTSSVKGVVPIAQIGKHRLRSTRPSAVYQHMQRLYSAWVESIFRNNSEQLAKQDLI